MRTLLSLLLLFAVETENAADFGGTAIVSKDSLSFCIPVYDVNDVWKWNVLPKGMFEYEWVFDIPVGEWARPPKKWVAHYAVIQESLGPPIIHGDLSDLLTNSKVYFWVTEEKTGEMFHVRKLDTFVKPAYDNGIIKFTLRRLGWLESITRYRPQCMILRGYYANGTTYEEPVTVINMKDPREQKARTISGPFSADEYAIYQTVIDRVLHDARRYQPRLEIYILNPSVNGELFPSEESNLKVLRADDDTVADYLKNRAIESDLTSLGALGYEVLDSEAYYINRRTGGAKDPKCGVRVSRIGFNVTRTQAIFYCAHSCGNLSGEGEAILMEKLDDEWLVARRVVLWLS